MTPRDAALSRSHAHGHATESRTDALPWVTTGLISGVLGAALVAVLFWIVDQAQGRPLHTPAALGAALFRGEPLTADTTAIPALVIGYTAIHGLVFVGFGLITAFLLLNAEQPPGPWRDVAIGGGLFLAFEIAFLAFAGLFDPALIGELGAGWVALANALAAAGMTLFLVARDRRVRRTWAAR